MSTTSRKTVTPSILRRSLPASVLAGLTATMVSSVVSSALAQNIPAPTAAPAAASPAPTPTTDVTPVPDATTATAAPAPVKAASTTASPLNSLLVRGSDPTSDPFLPAGYTPPVPQQPAPPRAQLTPLATATLQYHGFQSDGTTTLYDVFDSRSPGPGSQAGMGHWMKVGETWVTPSGASVTLTQSLNGGHSVMIASAGRQAQQYDEYKPQNNNYQPVPLGGQQQPNIISNNGGGGGRRGGGGGGRGAAPGGGRARPGAVLGRALARREPVGEGENDPRQGPGGEGLGVHG